MERFNALGRGAQLMLIGAVLLFIDLFFNWQEIDFDLGPLGEGSAGVNAWDNFWGVILGLLTIVLLAWLAVRIASVNIPLPVSTAMTAALLGVLIAFFAVVKNLVDDYSTIWSYIGVGLAIVILVGAFQTVQEAGGIGTLQSEASTLGASRASSTAEAPMPPAAPEPMTPMADAPAAAAPPGPAPEAMDDAAGAASDTEAASDVADDTTDEPSTRGGA